MEHISELMSKQAETPVISVILPTWNCADLLKEALDSVMAQSYKNWETIVINNNSKDHTKDVVNSFNDGRIKIIDFDNRGVIAAARNRGIETAAGEFVAFLDSDDLWYPQKLENCLIALQAHRADVVCHGERHFVIAPDNQRSEWDVFYGTNQPISYESLLYNGNFLSTSAVFAKLSLIREVGGFATDREIVTAEDYDLWLKLIGRGAKVHMLHEVLGAYRIHSSSASASIAKHLRAVRRVVSNHHNQHQKISKNSLGWAYFRRLSRITLSSCKALALKGDFKNSFKFALESMNICV
jgi:teichuronic acid biosynthesis glycosyltransferase TuaG